MVDFRVSGEVDVDTSAFVRAMLQVEESLDRVDSKINKVSRDIDELSHKQANINVEITGHAVEQMREIRTDVDELARKGARINVEITGDAKKQIDDITAKIDRLARKTAGISVDVNTDAAKAHIDELEAKLDRLAHDSASISVDVNTAGADAHLDEIKAKVDALGLKSPTINVDVDAGAALADMAVVEAEKEVIGKDVKIKVKTDDSGLQQVKNDANAARNAIDGGTGSGGLMGAILFLGPALAPLGIAAAGGLGAIVSSAAVAGAGIGAFAAFAIPTIKKVGTEASALQKVWLQIQQATTSSELSAALKKQKDLLDQMSPAEQAAVKSLISFENAYKSLAKTLEPDVFKVMNMGLNLATQILQIAAPIAKQGALAIEDLISAASKGLDGSSWKGFFDYVLKNTRDFIDIWGKAIGNFVTGIANMIVAFDPVTKQFNQGFLSMSQSFLNWTKGLADNKGWQNFIAAVKRDGPLVMKFIEDVIADIGKLVMVFDPIGEKIVGFVTDVANFVAGFAKAHPQLTQFAVAIAGVGLGLTQMKGPLGEALKLLDKIPGLGQAALVIGIIAMAFSALHDHGAAASKMVNQISEAFNKYLIPAGRELQGAFDKFVKDLMPEFVSIGQRLFAVIGPGFSGIAKVIHDDFAPAMSKILPVIEPIAKFLLEVFGSAVIGAVQGALEAIKGAIEAISGILSFFADLFTGNWSKLWGDVKQIVEGVWDLIKGAFEVWWNVGIMKGFRLGIDLIKGLWKDGWNAIKDFGSGIMDKIEGLLDDAWKYIKKGVSDAMSKAWDAIKTGFGNMLSSVKSIGGDIIGWISELPGKILAALGNLGRLLLQSGKDVLQGLWDGAKATWSSVIGWVQSIPSMILGALKGLGSLLFGVGKAILGGLLDGLKSSFEDVKSFIGGVGGWISSHKGPIEYDRTLLIPHGQAIMEGLMTGIAGQQKNLEATLGNVVKGIQATSLPQISTTIQGTVTAAQIAQAQKAQMQAANQNIAVHVYLDGEPFRAMAKAEADKNTEDLDHEISLGKRPYV